MYVEIRGDHAQVRDADDCRSLAVRVGVHDRARVDSALRSAGLGRWDGRAEAELTVAGLRSAAATSPVGANWAERWDAMVAYAQTKGWLTADGRYLRAHLVEVQDE